MITLGFSSHLHNLPVRISNHSSHALYHLLEHLIRWLWSRNLPSQLHLPLGKPQFLPLMPVYINAIALNFLVTVHFPIPTLEEFDFSLNTYFTRKGESNFKFLWDFQLSVKSTSINHLQLGDLEWSLDLKELPCSDIHTNMYEYIRHISSQAISNHTFLLQ